jgi:hypothetical protein
MPPRLAVRKREITPIDPPFGLVTHLVPSSKGREIDQAEKIERLKVAM